MLAFGYAVPLSASTIVMLFALQVRITDLTYRDGTRPVYSAIMVLTAILQSIALFALYRSLATKRKWHASMLVAAVAAMMLLSFFAANIDIDASAYVGYAKLPSFAAAYAPPDVRFHGGGFEVINTNWGSRLPRLVYGPLWLMYDRVTVGHASDYATALAILRAFNVLWLLALLLAIRRLRAGQETVAIVALNPALYFYYVIEAHNDLLPILLVTVGMAIARRRPLLGAIVAGASGLMKLTFVLIATFAYAGREKPRQCLAYLCVVIAITTVGSVLFGGGNYLHAMTIVGHDQIASRSDASHAVGAILHACVAAVAVIATIAAMFGGIFLAPATYSFSAISTIIYPWYLGWCIPYALRVQSFAAVFFIGLPALSHLIDPHFSLYPAHTFAILDAYYIVIIVLVFRFAALFRNRRPAAVADSIPVVGQS
jgi:hypothetical protein